MTIIAKKVVFYTDSFGAGTGINLAANVCAHLPGTTYDAQQTGSQSMHSAYNGLEPNGTPGWLGGLTMAQHTEAIQADTAVIHLGYNDHGFGGPFGDRFIAGDAGKTVADSYVAFMLAQYGLSAAASGRKIAVIQAPTVVPIDHGLHPDHDKELIDVFHAFLGRLQESLNAGVNQINASYPGAAKIISYRQADGAIPAITMAPGDTTDGLHPTSTKHLEISYNIAQRLGAWRGWTVV